MSTTPIAGFLLPTVNGDNNTWGTKLNSNWSTADIFSASAPQNVSSNFLVSANVAPERFYRVTTGGLNVTGTLPDPGTIAPGKLFTIKIVDIGSATLQCVNPVVTIDGFPTYTLSNQYSFVRLLANGATYDVVGLG